MSPPADLPQVALLSPEQIAFFKEQGYLVLPGAVDAGLCEAAQDDMWRILGEELPQMRRDDPSTWVPLRSDRWRREQNNGAHPGGDPLLECVGSRFYIRNGAEEPLLNANARALWGLAEQLLGRGEVLYPEGVNADGELVGPSYVDDGVQGGLQTHDDADPDGVAPFATRELTLPRTGPGWLIGQGSQGMYCTLPNSDGLGRDKPLTKPGQVAPWAGAHIDGLFAMPRATLQATVFVDACPPGCGGAALHPLLQFVIRSAPLPGRLYAVAGHPPPALASALGGARARRTRLLLEPCEP